MPKALMRMRRRASPRENGAERYSLVRKLTVTEPDAETLELSFAVSDGKGAAQLMEPLKRRQKGNQRLQKLCIAPCAATDLKVGNLWGRACTHLHVVNGARFLVTAFSCASPDRGSCASDRMFA